MTSPLRFVLPNYRALRDAFLAVACLCLVTACGGGGGSASGSSSSGGSSSGGGSSNGGPAPLPDSPPVMTISARQDPNEPKLYQVTWSSSSASSCVANGEWSGTKATSGSESVSTVTPDPYFGLSCSGSGGTTGISTTPELTGAGVTLTLSASPSVIEFGQQATLKWSARNATQCVASQDWEGSFSASGVSQSKAVTRNSEYSMRCDGPGGSAIATVDIALGETGIPVITLIANPSQVIAGTRTVIQWSALNATGCVRSGSWEGEVEAAGRETTDPLTQASTFGLSCTGPSGQAQATLAVPVDSSFVPPNDPPVAFRKANPVQDGGRDGHRQWIVGSTEPVQGAQDQVFELELEGDVAEIAFSVVDEANGANLGAVPFSVSPYATRLLRHYVGKLTVPGSPFRLRAVGTDAKGTPFNVVSRLFGPQDFSFAMDGEMLPITRTQPSTFSLQLRNAGPAGSFVVTGAASTNTTLTPGTQTIDVAANSVATVTFQVTRGVDFPRMGAEHLTLTASRAGAASGNNSLDLLVVGAE